MQHYLSVPFRARALFIAVIAIACFLGLHQRHAAAVESYTLDNGLKVILYPQPGSGVVSGRLTVKVGSVDEQAGEYGLAHVLEHMAFKATAKRKAGELTSQVESNGGRTNAYTTTDKTSYEMDLPADHLELLLDILADMTFAPLFLDEELVTEKEVVVEEIRRGLDNPNRHHFQKVRQLLYGDNPLGREVIGTIESVRNMSAQTIRDFHNRYYRPDNAVLMVVGDFDPVRANQLVAKYYRHISNPDQPKPEQNFLPARRAEKPATLVEDHGKMPVPVVTIAFRSFNGQDADVFSADVLATIMGGSLSSRLEERISREKELVTSISFYTSASMYDGYALLSFEAEPDKVAAAFAAVLEELENFFISPPGRDEIERARTAAKSGFITSMDSIASISMWLNFFEIDLGDWRLLDAYVAAMDKTTSADLERIADRLWGDRNMVVVATMPESSGIDIADLKRSIDASIRDFSPRPQRSAAAVAPQFVEQQPVAGIRLFVMEDPSRQVVKARAGVVSGTIAETPGNNGISNFMASAWAEATGKRDSETLGRDIDRLGASINGFSGVENAGLDGTFMHENWQDGLELFAEILTSPAFDQTDVELVRRNLIARRLSVDERLEYQVSSLADSAFYPDQYLGMEMLGPMENLVAFQPADLLEWYRSQIRNGSMAIMVAGNVEAEKVRAILSASLEPWRAGVEAERIRPAKPPAPPAAFEMVSKAIEREQVHIQLLYPAPSQVSKDRAAMQVLSTHFSGMGGPLFMDLRDRRGLAYSVYGYYMPRMTTGTQAFYIASAADKAAEAVDGLREVVQREIDAGLTDKQVETAKTYLLGNLRIGNQSLSNKVGRALTSTLFGLGPNHFDTYLDEIATVTAADVNRVAATYLKPEHSVMAVVGSKSAIVDATKAVAETAAVGGE